MASTQDGSIPLRFSEIRPSLGAPNSKGPDKNPAEPQNPWREEVVSTIFGNVGKIKQDYTCAIQRQILLQGRMYVSEKFVCFYSNLFGFEKKVKIPYAAITACSKEYTAGMIPNAICISTNKREYVFRSFWDRDRALLCIAEAYEHARGVSLEIAAKGSNAAEPKTEPKTGGSNDAGGARRGGTREASLPSARVGPLDEPGGRDRPQAEPAGPVEPAAAGGRGTFSAGDRATFAARHDAGDSEPPSPPSATPPSVLSPAYFFSRSQSHSGSAGSFEEGEDEDEEGGADRSVGSGSNPMDLGAAFAATLEKRTFKHLAATATFPCSLGDFERFFVGCAEVGCAEADQQGGGPEGARQTADTSSLGRAVGPALVLGVPEFHELQGDSEIEVDDWTESPCPVSGLAQRVRSFRFRTPLVGTPIGPSSTRATKTQCWRRFGDLGLVLDEVTVLEDIPYGDCFECQDRWVVVPKKGAAARGAGGQPDGQAGGEAGGEASDDEVEITINVELRWVKSTMWQRAIELKTVMDMTTFFEKALETFRQRHADRASARVVGGSEAHALDSGGGGGGSSDHRQALLEEMSEPKLGDDAASLPAGGLGHDHIWTAWGRGLTASWFPWAVLAVFLLLKDWRDGRLEAARHASLVAELAALQGEMRDLAGLLAK